MGKKPLNKLVFGLFIFLLSGCVTLNIGEKPSAPVSNNDWIQQTVQAIQGGWNQGNNQANIPSSSGQASSNNYSITPTGDNYAPPPPSQNSSSANQQQQTPCLLVGKVRDINIPDGYQMNPGSLVTKTWELTNGGSCTWDANFEIVYADGNLRTPVQTKAIGKSVAPGGTVQVTIPVQAPSQSGTYTAYYKMRSSSGSSFGTGSNANSAFWVKITVAGQPVQPPSEDSTPLILLVSYPSNVQNYTNQPCPYKVTLTAFVTPNKNVSDIFYFYCPQTKTRHIVIGQGNLKANYLNTIKITQTIEKSGQYTYILCSDKENKCYSPGISVNITCQQKFAITSVQWSKSKYTVYSSTSTFSVAPSLEITSNGAGSVDYIIGTTGSSFSSCTSKVWKGRLDFKSASRQIVGLTGIGFQGPCKGEVYFYATYPDGTQKKWSVPLEAIKK